MTPDKRLTSSRRLSSLAFAIDEFLRAQFPSKNPRLMAACSGGPDSVALVHALAEIAAHRKLHVEIGHVNHRLRGKESDADQRFVEGLARRLGWRAHVARCPVKGDGNVEERARELRYAALCTRAKKRRLDAVLTAHTMDDQAETVLMNLLRGSGAEGLAGMRSVRKDAATGVLIARPLLMIDRAAVRAYATKTGGFRTDRTNRDPRFLRNYVRISLFPQLEKRLPGFQQRIGRLAELLRDELPVLATLADRAAQRVGKRHRGGWLVDWKALKREPVAIQRRVLRKAAGRDLLTFDGVEGLRLWMASPPKSGRLWQLRKGWIVERLSKSKGFPSPTLFWFRQMPSTAVRSRTLGTTKGR